ncbi:MAG: deoxynucleoside kinase [Saprospiraceae bacterium]|nr:deoxynucleoside kinase [Saprospiraceae bacterium]
MKSSLVMFETKTPFAKHIAIAGNIGAGKTTLTTKLAKHFGWEPQFESVDNNPYLADFYHDMHRWSFNLQIYFLNSRYRDILEIQKGNRVVIQDRTIYEDAHIFAPNLHEMGLMSKRDYDNYFSLFELMIQQVSPPDLMIYLKASIPTLVDHIQQRGRDYEGTISIDYLKKLNERYDKWVSGYKAGKLLVINADEIDFLNRPEDLGLIISKIQAELHGLF